MDPIGEQGGLNLYAHVDNNPICQSDEFGLWKRDEWKGKRGKYIGTACKESGDTLEKLAEYITGRSGDASLARLLPGGTYDISKLLVKLEDNLRKNVVKAAKRFRSAPEYFRAQSPNINLVAREINRFFNGATTPKGSLYGADCHGGAMLVMAKGVMSTLHSGEFDKLGYILGDFNRGGRMMERQNQPTIETTAVGDWMYIKGYSGYNARIGANQGDNAIKVGADSYFVNGIGIIGLSELVEGLESSINDKNQSISKSEKIKGYIRSQTVFINVSQLGMHIFDYRQRNKK